MLDLKFIRANAELVKAGARKKRIDCDVDRVIALDERRRVASTRADELRARQNETGRGFARADVATRERLLGEQKELKGELKAIEEQLVSLQA